MWPAAWGYLLALARNYTIIVVPAAFILGNKTKVHNCYTQVVPTHRFVKNVCLTLTQQISRAWAVSSAGRNRVTTIMILQPPFLPKCCTLKRLLDCLPMATTPRGFSNGRSSYCPGAGPGWLEAVVGVNLLVPAYSIRADRSIEIKYTDEGDVYLDPFVAENVVCTILRSSVATYILVCFSTDSVDYLQLYGPWATRSVMSLHVSLLPKQMHVLRTGVPSHAVDEQ